MAEGLRERKMRLTRQQMEQAAVDIAYEEGVNAVTVDRVCAAAMVSRSTFFNYFPSLTVAIFGGALEYDRELTDRIISEHSKNLVIASSLIVLASVRGDADDPVTRRRTALFAREPGITSTVSWSSNESRRRLEQVFVEWLEAHPEDRRLAEVPIETEARFIVSMSILLGDEVQRHTPEVNGELIVDIELYRRVCAQLGAAVTPATP